MEAILWDGIKQLKGKLEFFEDRLVFDLEDFRDSSLHLSIPYHLITGISYKRIFEIENGAIQVTSHEGKQNTFVVDQPDLVLSEIEEKVIKSKPYENNRAKIFFNQ